MLLGGEGTRLRPLTLTLPKQVLPVAEVPMIERVLDHLAAHGVTEAVLSLGYLNQAFVDLFPDGRSGEMELRYAIEPEPLDTAGAIAFAARQAGIDEAFLVANGDVLTDLDVSAMIDHHRSRGAQTTLALARVSDPSAFGLVHTDDDDRVVEFVEKPPTGSSPGPGWVSAGTYLLEPSVLDRIPAGRRVSVEREIFPAVVAAGGLYGFPSVDYWTDTGTPGQYLAAQLDLLTGRRPGPPAPGARYDGHGRWVLGQARIDGDVTGPALLGDGAHVAGGARVSSSVVGARSTIRAGAVVRGSVLLPGTVVHEGARVDGSIVGHGATIGARATVVGLSVVGPGRCVAAGSSLDGERLPVSV